MSVLSYTDGLCALCTKWGGGICTDHGTDRGPLREREIEEDRERERKRERDREIEHFSGARPRREYEWLIARAAASGRELRAFVCLVLMLIIGSATSLHTQL